MEETSSESGGSWRSVAELPLLKGLLKASRGGPVSVGSVAEEVPLPQAEILLQLRRLESEGILHVHGEALDISERERLKLLLRIISSGGDLGETSRLLRWGEFEGLVALMVRQHSYSVIRNLRFRHRRRLREADVVGVKEPLILCIDCKHLRSRQSSVVRQAALANADRAQGLARELPRLLPRLGIEAWVNVTVVPVIVTLKPVPWRLLDRMPIVSVNQLRDFLEGLPGEASLFAGFKGNTTEDRSLPIRHSDESSRQPSGRSKLPATRASMPSHGAPS